MGKIKKSGCIGCVWLFIGVGATFGYCNTMGCKLQEVAVHSFDECVKQGFYVDDSDPPKCIITKDKIFEQPPQNIKVTAPKAAQYVVSPFTIKGEALVQNNTIYYRLLASDGKVMSEGSQKTASPDHGRYGTYSMKMNFQKGEYKEGKVVLFEKNPDGKEESLVEIPINFVKNDSTQTNGINPLENTEEVAVTKTLEVSFTPQAPFADWNSTFNESCEEASLLMTEYFIQGKELNPTIATSEITLMVDWEKNHGYKEDVTIQELAGIAEAYYNRGVRTFSNTEVTVENIKKLISEGYPVIIPAAGKLLKNPHYRGDGPPYHMMVIIGYDEKNFITNDPGTKEGEKYAYSQELLMDAIHDWTGNKDTVTDGKKAMMIVEK